MQEKTGTKIPMQANGEQTYRVPILEDRAPMQRYTGVLIEYVMD